MSDNKSYEDKINDIKKYLEEKEKEVKDNRVNKSNPIKKDNGLVFDDYSNNYNDIYKSNDSDDVIGNKEEVKIEKKEIKNKEDKCDYKKCKLNVILFILLFITPLFMALSVISSNSTYLIRKPFNFVFYALTGISMIWIICILLLKALDKNKTKKKKYIIASIVTIILNILFMILCLKGKFWTHLDPIIEHKKFFVLLFLGLIIIFIIFLIIMKKKHIKIKKSIKKMLLTIFMTLYILCFIDLVVVLYGPAKEFKEWLITTAMQTMHHQYFCKWFYNNGDIEYVMSQNYVQESGESTDASLIKKNQEEKVVYENEYEEAVLKKEHKNDLYKIIELDVNGCKGYLAVIYDPTTVHVAVTNKVGRAGQYVTEMAKDRDAVLGINGGGFWDPGNTSAGGTPTGITIEQGKIITNGEYGWNVQAGGIIGFDKEGILHLLKNTTAQEAIDMGITDAVSWGPFLIVNGTPSFIKGNGGWGYAARTAIGQREDGIVLLLTIDSNATRTKGADMVDLTEIMQNYGAVNAANLDGGTSTVMVMPQETALKYNPNCSSDYCIINDPIDGGLSHATRAIADAFVVIPNE